MTIQKIPQFEQYHPSGLRQLTDMHLQVSYVDDKATWNVLCDGFLNRSLIRFNLGSWEFNGYVTAKIEHTFATVFIVKPTGVPVMEQSHINCRCALSEEKSMSPKNDKRPRFYVGSKKVFQARPELREAEPWAKYTEKEAIDHAKQLLEKTGEEQFIVKIIKVVRRKPQPIVVETLRG